MIPVEELLKNVKIPLSEDHKVPVSLTHFRHASHMMTGEDIDIRKREGIKTFYRNLSMLIYKRHSSLFESNAEIAKYYRYDRSNVTKSLRTSSADLNMPGKYGEKIRMISDSIFILAAIHATVKGNVLFQAPSHVVYLGDLNTIQAVFKRARESRSPVFNHQCSPYAIIDKDLSITTASTTIHIGSGVLIRKSKY